MPDKSQMLVQSACCSRRGLCTRQRHLRPRRLFARQACVNTAKLKFSLHEQPFRKLEFPLFSRIHMLVVGVAMYNVPRSSLSPCWWSFPPFLRSGPGAPISTPFYPQNDKDPEHEKKEEHQVAPLSSLPFSHSVHPLKSAAQKCRCGREGLVLSQNLRVS
jgi:hypothetical protein